MKVFLVFVFFCVLCVLSGCSGKPPFLEYTLAHSAIQSADKVQSKHHASRQWRNAINYYNRGEENFGDRHYMSARRFFEESRRWAQNAEHITRLKMSSGKE